MSNINEGMASIESTRNIRNLSHELFSNELNVDPISSHPFETPKARARIMELITKGINEKGTIVFVDADMDNLKHLNDSLGHAKTNEAIKKVIDEKNKAVEGLEESGYFLLWRPQAGGDEFRILFVFTETNDLEESINKVKQALKPETNFEGKKITCSFGMIVKQLNGHENPGEVLQEMEQVAERKQMEEKMKKINKRLEEILKVAETSSPDEFIKGVSEALGSTRIGKEGLERLLKTVYLMGKE